MGHEPELADGVAEHLATVGAFVGRAGRWNGLAEGRRPADGSEGRTLSVHARRGPDPDTARLMLAQIASDALDHGLVPTTGREVLEVRPPVAVNKGSAVRMLLATAARGWRCTSATTAPTPNAWRIMRQMRTDGALDVAVGVAVASGEVPSAVREAADVEVPGPPGALQGAAPSGPGLGLARGDPGGGEAAARPAASSAQSRVLATSAARAPARRAVRTPKRM